MAWANRHIERQSNGGGGGLEDRVKALEEAALVTRDRLARIEVRVEQCATKEDLHREMNAVTTKFVGWMWAVLGTYTTAVGLFLAIFWHYQK